jgi:beta-N-acetylhexosaminidase
MSVISEEARGDYAEKYDAALIFANVKGFAQETAIRIKWSSPMAAEIPWYVTEVPTVFVSLTQPNHLIDVPMVKPPSTRTPTPRRPSTPPSRRSWPVKVPGHLQRHVFCDSFDTRL